MEWFDFLALVLAHGAAMEAWFKGSLFAMPRAVMQSKDTQFWGEDDPLPQSPEAEAAPDVVEEPLPKWWRFVDRWVPNIAGALLSCAFCLSYHAPFWIGLAFWVPSLWLPHPWNVLCKFPIYSFAVTRAGNILTGLLPARLRYEDEDE
jgi:hypothetical protein